ATSCLTSGSSTRARSRRLRASSARAPRGTPALTSGSSDDPPGSLRARRGHVLPARRCHRERGDVPVSASERVDVPVLIHLISALGVRPVRVPRLGEPFRLYVRSRTALVDTDATASEWDRLCSVVLASMPELVGQLGA